MVPIREFSARGAVVRMAEEYLNFTLEEEEITRIAELTGKNPYYLHELLKVHVPSNSIEDSFILMLDNLEEYFLREMQFLGNRRPILRRLYRGDMDLQDDALLDALDSLIEDHFLIRTTQGYAFRDQVFKRWFGRKFFGDG